MMWGWIILCVGFGHAVTMMLRGDIYLALASFFVCGFAVALIYRGQHQSRS